MKISLLPILLVTTAATAVVCGPTLPSSSKENHPNRRQRWFSSLPPPPPPPLPSPSIKADHFINQEKPSSTSAPLGIVVTKTPHKEHKGNGKLLVDASYQLDRYLDSNRGGKSLGLMSDARREASRPRAQITSIGKDSTKDKHSSSSNLIKSGMTDNNSKKSDRSTVLPLYSHSTSRLPLILDDNRQADGEQRLSSLASTSRDKKGKAVMTDSEAQLDEYSARMKSRQRSAATMIDRQTMSTASMASTRSSHESNDKKTEYWDDRIRKQGWKGILQWERRQAFDRLWKAKKLSTDMNPIKLADEVISLRLEKGIHTQSIASLASLQVKAKKDAEYENAYIARMAQVLPYLSDEMKKIEKDPFLSKLDQDKKMKIVLDETFKAVAKNDKKRKRASFVIAQSEGASSTHNTAPLAYKKEAAERIERVGNLARNHLKSIGLDFDTMNISHLVDETRDLKSLMPEITQTGFTKALYRYIKHQRRISDMDLTAIRRARRNH